MYHPKLDLQFAVPARVADATPGALIARGLDDETLAQRARLAGELAHYLGRLAELDKLDPHDFTGLKRIFGEHVSRTRRLLEQADA